MSSLADVISGADDVSKEECEFMLEAFEEASMLYLEGRTGCNREASLL